MDKKLSFKMKVLRFTKKYKKRTTTHTLIATAALLFLLVLIPTFQSALVHGKPVNVNQSNTFTASFTGDLIFDNYYDKYINYNGTQKITQYVNNYLQNSDYVTGNVIGSFTDTESELLTAFRFSVVDIYDGTDTDANILESKGIAYVKTPSVGENNIIYQQINNMKVATLGTTEIGYIDDLKVINQAKSNADTVVVHINWYDKYTTNVNDDQRSIAKALSDAGADFIIGHNTRVLQPIELYRDTVIIYSLGNFLHGEAYASTLDSAIIQYTIDSNSSSKTLQIIPLSLFDGRPQPVFSLTGLPNRKKIYNVLTRELPKTLEITEKNGILSIKLN